jgi:FkbH-like protein
LTLYVAPYGQLETDLLDPTSALYHFDPALVLFVPSLAQLRQEFYALPPAEKPGYSRQWIDRFQQLCRPLLTGSDAHLLLPTFPLIDDGVFGHLAAHTRLALPNQLRRLTLGLMDLAESQPRLHLFDLAARVAQQGLDHWQDQRLHLNADVPYRLDAEAQFAWELVAWMAVWQGDFHKAIILDLDGVLWGGIIGEDGLTGIQLGESGVGKAYVEWQQWLRQLRERGILLAVCSKNDPATAWEPFDAHPHMVLRRADIALFVANWDNKADNLRQLQQQLALSWDSLVFLDDSPAERALIRRELPEVTVPELPADPAQYLAYLQSLNLFDTRSHVPQDRLRTAQYQAQSERQVAAAQVTDLDAFLRSLDLRGRIVPLPPDDLPRLAQLTQRSNQFNLTTLRYTAADLDAIRQDPAYLSYAASLRDRFGPHGWIGLLIAHRESQTDLLIQHWCMSCRVLRRGVPHWLLHHVGTQARRLGYQRLIGRYLPTTKNALVADLYPRLGFTRLDEQHWTLALDEVLAWPHHIQEDQDQEETH